MDKIKLNNILFMFFSALTKPIIYFQGCGGKELPLFSALNKSMFF